MYILMRSKLYDIRNSGSVERMTQTDKTARTHSAPESWRYNYITLETLGMVWHTWLCALRRSETPTMSKHDLTTDGRSLVLIHFAGWTWLERTGVFCCRVAMPSSSNDSSTPGSECRRRHQHFLSLVCQCVDQSTGPAQRWAVSFVNRTFVFWTMIPHHDEDRVWRMTGACGGPSISCWLTQHWRRENGSTI